MALQALKSQGNKEIKRLRSIRYFGSLILLVSLSCLIVHMLGEEASHVAAMEVTLTNMAEVSISVGVGGQMCNQIANIFDPHLYPNSQICTPFVQNVSRFL